MKTHEPPKRATAAAACRGKVIFALQVPCDVPALGDMASDLLRALVQRAVRHAEKFCGDVVGVVHEVFPLTQFFFAA